MISTPHKSPSWTFGRTLKPCSRDGVATCNYVPSGHLVYGARGTLRAVAFDLERMAIAGSPVTVLEQVMTTPVGAVDAMVAANGTLVYAAGGGFAGVERSLV